MHAVGLDDVRRRPAGAKNARDLRYQTVLVFVRDVADDV